MSRLTSLFLGLSLLTFVNLAHADNCSTHHLKKPVAPAMVFNLGQFPRFDQIRGEDFMPHLDILTREGMDAASQVRFNATATFENTILPIDRVMQKLDELESLLGYYATGYNSELYQKLEPEFEKRTLELRSQIFTDRTLFEKFKHVYQRRGGLKHDQQRLVESYYNSFRDEGVDLSPENLDKYLNIRRRLADARATYKKNITDFNETESILVTDVKELDGVRPSTIENLAKRAQKAGLTGYQIPMDPGITGEIMSKGTNSELRKKIFMMGLDRAYKGERDNSNLVREIASLRHESAVLLGEPNYATGVLKDRMIGSLDRVKEFIKQLTEAYRPQAEKDDQEFRDYVESKTGSREVEPWNRGYWATQLLKEKYSYDDEKIREYFPYERVKDGLLSVIQRLYGFEMRLRNDLPRPSTDADNYQLIAADGSTLGFVTVDLYERPKKKSGAWMSPLVSSADAGGPRRPAVVGVTMNLQKPTGSEPLLLTIDQSRTLFHEFGHALHGLVSKARYYRLAGTSVKWDFVELPSQLMENFFVDRDNLKAISRHYKTGESIPDADLDAMDRAAHFQVGLGVLGQIAYQMVDIGWHSGELLKETGLMHEIENRLLAPVTLRTPEYPSSIAVKFLHIFYGGYSSGYYSYRWSEVLDAQAFEVFRKHGTFSPEIAQRYLRTILEVGDTVDPLTAFRNFTGQDPDPEAMFRRDGVRP